MGAAQPDYSAAGVDVREDLRASHAAMLGHFRRPGNWFSGAERLAIAAESRRAVACGFCRERKAALSPEHASGRHDSDAVLRPPLVDLVHRVRTDSGRLSKPWFEGVLASGISEGEYVEAVGLVAMTAGIDSLCRALGASPFTLPTPLAGEPSRRRPDGLAGGTAWVSLLAPEDATGPEADIYGGSDFVPNIVRALSVVPDHVRALRAWSDVHYVDLQDFGARRAIDRQQIELVAARVSALNECFY